MLPQMKPSDVCAIVFIFYIVYLSELLKYLCNGWWYPSDKKQHKTDLRGRDYTHIVVCPVVSQDSQNLTLALNKQK